jgi:hypothetical protein
MFLGWSRLNYPLPFHISLLAVGVGDFRIPLAAMWMNFEP